MKRRIQIVYPDNLSSALHYELPLEICFGKTSKRTEVKENRRRK